MSSNGEARRGRVLILAAEFPPLGGGGVIRVTKLVKYLHRLGWDVEVGSSDEPLANAVDPALLDEIPPPVRVHRVRAPGNILARRATSHAKHALSRGSTLFRTLLRIRSLVRSAFAIPDRWLPWALTVASYPHFRRPDVIVASGPPHSVHIAAAALAKRWTVPYVADLRDEWTLRPLTRSRLPWRRVIEGALERWSLTQAAAVVVVSDSSRARYQARYKQLSNKLIVIPNGFDPEDIDQLDLPARSRNGELVIGYAGSFQVGTDVRPLFDALARIAKTGVGDRSVKIHLVGPILPETVDLARRRIPDSALKVTEFVSHREALRLMAGWDAGLMIANDGKASLAGKLYEYLALQKPVAVIAPPGPATQLVEESATGTVGHPASVVEIEAAVRDALAMSDEFGGIPDDLLSKYDRRRQAHRWSTLLERLTRR